MLLNVNKIISTNRQNTIFMQRYCFLINQCYIELTFNLSIQQEFNFVKIY